MPIENRDLKPGDVVTGTSKKTKAVAFLIAGEPDYEGADAARRKDHWLIDEPPHMKGQTFTSLSAAASAIVGSNQNGWRFFTLVPRAGKTEMVGRPEPEGVDPQTVDAMQGIVDELIEQGEEPTEADEAAHALAYPNEGDSEPVRAARAKPAPRVRTYNPIHRVPNQKGVEPGLTRYYCDGCLASFMSSDTEPAVRLDAYECPNGHQVSEMRDAASRPTPVEAVAE